MRFDIARVKNFLDQCKANRELWWGSGLTGRAIAVNDDSKKMEEILRYIAKHYLTIRDFAKQDPVKNSTFNMHENILIGAEDIVLGETPDDDIGRFIKK